MIDNLNYRKSKHGRRPVQCLTCAMEDVLMQKQIRDWEKVFELAYALKLPRAKKRWQ